MSFSGCMVILSWQWPSITLVVSFLFKRPCQTLRKSFWGDYKLRSPVCVRMQKDHRIVHVKGSVVVVRVRSIMGGHPQITQHALQISVFKVFKLDTSQKKQKFQSSRCSSWILHRRSRKTCLLFETWLLTIQRIISVLQVETWLFTNQSIRLRVSKVDTTQRRSRPLAIQKHHFHTRRKEAGTHPLLHPSLQADSAPLAVDAPGTWTCPCRSSATCRAVRTFPSASEAGGWGSASMTERWCCPSSPVGKLGFFLGNTLSGLTLQSHRSVIKRGSSSAKRDY